MLIAPAKQTLLFVLQITVKVDVHRPFKKRKITLGFLKQLPLQRQQTTEEAEKIEVAPVKETYRACNVKESRQKVVYDEIYSWIFMIFNTKKAFLCVFFQGGFFGRLWRRLKKSSNMK